MNRTEARELVARPGKFEGESPMVPLLWECFMLGGADDDNGELVRLGRWTLRETDQGFVIGQKHPSEALAVEVMETTGENCD